MLSLEEINFFEHAKNSRSRQNFGRFATMDDGSILNPPLATYLLCQNIICTLVTESSGVTSILAMSSAKTARQGDFYARPVHQSGISTFV